jgi:multicomponent Na+:H+ antiporter subunit B
MDGMSCIVKTVTRWLKGFILLFGTYIVLYGHLTPGGGFSGGVIIACAFILLTLAEGKKISTKTLSKAVAGELDSVGALIFLVVALAGLIKAGAFFKNIIQTSPESYFRLVSSGLIPVSNIGIGLKVGTSLFLVFIVLSAIHIGPRKSRKEDE